DQRSCVDHWLHIRNFALGNDEVSQGISRQFAGAFDEDKAVLEAIQREEDELQESRKPLRIAIDGGVVRMRGLMADLIAAESQAHSTTQPRAKLGARAAG